MEASHSQAATWKEVVPATGECHSNQDQLPLDFLNTREIFLACSINFFFFLVICSQTSLSKAIYNLQSHLICIAYKVLQQWQHGLVLEFW